MIRRRKTPNGTLTIPGFDTSIEPDNAKVSEEDAIRLIIHEHPEDFVGGLAAFGLAPRYEWETAASSVDTLALILIVVMAAAAAPSDPWITAILLGGVAGTYAGIGVAAFRGYLEGLRYRQEARARRRARRGYLR